jgi:serine/threonine protein kinase
LNSRYEVRELLGKGGMGVVYRAYDNVVKTDVALKTLVDVGDSNALALFRDECEKLASLVHPNLIEIRDVGEFVADGEVTPYLVMPLLRGRTLAELILDAPRPLTVERSIDIVVHACRGLHEAHNRGLIHRDLKPRNIFVLEDDSVKLIDFGIAQWLNAARSMAWRGTLLYMSPEQVDMKVLSPRSDIFSLGVVCYETLTGSQPFTAPTQEEIVARIKHHIPPPASELNSAAGQLVSQVVHKAMAKDPTHRFSTAREFADMLSKALHNEPIEMFNPVHVTPRQQSAEDALLKRDYPLAEEILSDLEPEGHLHPGMPPLRQKVDDYKHRAAIDRLREDVPQYERFIPAKQAVESVAGQRRFPSPEQTSPKKSPRGWLIAAGTVITLAAFLVMFWSLRRPPPYLEFASGDMVFVPGGEAQLGSDKQPVRVNPFYIDKTEVTTRAYLIFCRETGRAISPGVDEARLDYPVVNVTFDDAQTFASWARKRLPTAIEWEKAARGANGQSYPWGSEMRYDIANVPKDKIAFETAVLAPALSNVEGASPYGALNMLGNVWEWVTTRKAPPAGHEFENYEQIFKELTPPLSRTEPFYQLRGGSYQFVIPEGTTPATLIYDATAFPARARRKDVGFRCAMNP